ncbi:MAG: TRAP transporter substrate-binding protein [Alphaproteobacteria bacterium]|nr:TRAP transporter substrate-binding protein [Alphaproteobacteria bacterium]
MFSRRNFTVSAAALGLAMGLSSAASAEKWDMPLAYSATNYHSQIAAEFAAEVTEKTGGKLEIVTHPSGSLFGGAEIFSAVRRGLAPIGERLVSALSNENPIYEMDSIPFLATSFPEAKALYAAQKPALTKLLDDANLVFLYSGPWPPQGFYSKVQAGSKAELKGLKFRAYNATTSRVAELMGMLPTKIEAAELSQAFATGVAESMISSGSTGYDRKLWEHVDYFYDVRAWLPRNMVFVNKDAWEGLDEATQGIILDAAATAESKVWAKSEELADYYLEQFTKEGMTVGDAPAGLKADFQAAGQVLLDEWKEKAGDDGAALLAEYEAKQ